MIVIIILYKGIDLLWIANRMLISYYRYYETAEVHGNIPIAIPENTHLQLTQPLARLQDQLEHRHSELTG